MFLIVFLMTLFALTVLAAVERSVTQSRRHKKTVSRTKLTAQADRECAIYRASIQALKTP